MNMKRRRQFNKKCGEKARWDVGIFKHKTLKEEKEGNQEKNQIKGWF